MTDSATNIGAGRSMPVVNDGNVGAVDYEISTLGGQEFDAHERATPENPKKSGGFKSFFATAHKNVSNVLSKFSAMVTNRTTPASHDQGETAGRARPAGGMFDHVNIPDGDPPATRATVRNSYESVNVAAGEHNPEVSDRTRVAILPKSVNGVSPGQVVKNMTTIDDMTNGDSKIPFAIKEKIAKSPTLMEHLRKYEAAGYKLEFVPDTPEAGKELEGGTGIATFSLEYAAEDPDTFIKNFAEVLLKNEVRELQLGSDKPGMKTPALIQHTNENTVLPKIIEELENVGPVDVQTEMPDTDRDSFAALHAGRDPGTPTGDTGARTGGLDPFPEDVPIRPTTAINEEPEF